MLRLIKRLICFIIVLALICFAAYCAICINFPVKHLDIINKYAEQYNLRPSLVCAVIKTESSFNEDATSHKGALGLMQLMPDTIDWAVEEIPIEGFSYADINDPDTNIRLGCWVLGFLSRQFEDNEELVIASYNAGIGNVKKWLGDTQYSRDGEYLHYIPYKETADYVKRVKLYDKVYAVLLNTSFFEQGIVNETTDDN